jgi:hypothetical protein
MNSRTIPLSLSGLIAVFSALVALALSGHHQMSAMAATAHPRAVPSSEVALRTDIRRLWEDHVMWTRLAVISLTSGSPDTNATVARLLRNQVDIGNAVKPFYGAAAGTQLSTLLREHILIAADLITAAKKGDRAGIAAQSARWTVNADRLAAFLTSANPQNWKLAAMKAMLHEHLALTTAEVVDRLQHRWAADVHAYDEINAQALHMADMLSAGLVAQFPGRFR